MARARPTCFAALVCLALTALLFADERPPATLRLGEGFRCADAAVVAKDDPAGVPPDVVFKYVPSQSAGTVARYNPITGQVEQAYSPAIDTPIPLIAAPGGHAWAFDDKPDLARTTTGDLAARGDDAALSDKSRYALVHTSAGNAYLLTVAKLVAPPAKYDAWRVTLSAEPVHLPLGAAGGKPNPPLPGKLVFRDWFRSKRIVRVDLTNGAEAAFADGTLPDTTADGARLAYLDPAGSYVIADAAGKTLRSIAPDVRLLDAPRLSPDGRRVLMAAERPGPPLRSGSITLPGPPAPTLLVFDLTGRELAAVAGYDDAVWTPEGKVVATAKYDEPGLFEIEVDTATARPIDAHVDRPAHPALSPDGKTIAYVTAGRIVLADRAGRNPRPLLPDEKLRQRRPAFSPDGKHLAAVVCNHPGVDQTGDVIAVDLATRETIPLRTATGSPLTPDPTSRLNWVP